MGITMTNDVMRMFKNAGNELTVIDLEAELEKTVRSAIRLTRRKWSGIDLVPQALEKKVVPIIKKVLMNINPEMLTNVRKMDARVIWAIYWQTQTKPVTAQMSFLKLLEGLDRNPPFASIFA
jgi:hypothetical protein